MKIEGTGKTAETKKSKKSGKASGSDARFGDFIASGPKKAAQTQTTQSIVQVDALLALQGVDDATERASRGRMQQRCDDILDELDKIRMSILHGNVTVGDIVNIADVVASHREQISDPKLTELMDEIDLRAQVELAKMRVALDK